MLTRKASITVAFHPLGNNSHALYQHVPDRKVCYLLPFNSKERFPSVVCTYQSCADTRHNLSLVICTSQYQYSQYADQSEQHEASKRSGNHRLLVDRHISACSCEHTTAPACLVWMWQMEPSTNTPRRLHLLAVCTQISSQSQELHQPAMASQSQWAWRLSGLLTTDLSSGF